MWVKGSEIAYILRNALSCCGLSTAVNELSSFVWKPKNLKILKILKNLKFSKTEKSVVPRVFQVFEFFRNLEKVVF